MAKTRDSNTWSDLVLWTLSDYLGNLCAMTPKKKTAKRPDNAVDQTLAQFSDAVDEYFGAQLGFADTVVALAAVRADVAEVEARRGELWDEIKRQHSGGAYVASYNPAPGGGYFLHQSTTAVGTRRTVPSAIAKKAGLWEAARVQKPWLVTKAPEAAVLPRRELKLPSAHPLVLRKLTLGQIIESHRSAAFDVLADLREDEKRLRAELAEIRAGTDWDGSEIVFADDWKVGLWRLEYDAEALRKIAPKEFERLAIEVPTGGVTRLSVMDLALAEEKGLCDPGSYDGFAE